MTVHSEPLSTPRRETLNLRIKADERHLIDRAARLHGVNRTKFILDAARLAAEEAILERTIISASPAAYDALVALLDAPPQPDARLRATMQTLAPWDK